MITNIERMLDEIRKQALIEGKVEGKLEGKLETVRTALMEGVNIDMICKITGLSLETILELKKDLVN